MVDDSGYAVRPLMDILRADGHEVIWAGDGPTGLQMAAQLVPDLVLLDVMMPGMDGYEVLKRLRADPALGQIPVLLLTALDDRESRLRGFEAGADDFLSKPPDREELRARIRTVLGLGRFRRLLRERSKVESIVEAAPDGILVVLPGDGGGGRIAQANPAIARLLGAGDRDALVGRRLAEVMPLDGRRFEALLDRGTPMPSAWEATWPRDEGGTVTVEISGTPVAWDTGPALLLVVRDITTRRRLEEEVRRGQRLDAMARLAGGLAHDFRSYLGSVRTSALLLRDDLPLENPSREDAERIVALADEAAGLVARLLAFAQRQELEPRVLDLNPLVESWRPVMQHLLGRSAGLSIVLAPEPLWTVADPIQLQQVVTNLVGNARDALGPSGRVTVSTAGRRDGDRRWVRLTVRDDGAGMAPEVVERVFEPFFTTKESGTGFGLSIVHGIVRQLGGRVAIDSAPGRGTTVDVDLPAAPAPG